MTLQVPPMVRKSKKNFSQNDLLKIFIMQIDTADYESELSFAKFLRLRQVTGSGVRTFTNISRGTLASECLAENFSKKPPTYYIPFESSENGLHFLQ
jgi:hypothetical protein